MSRPPPDLAYLARLRHQRLSAVTEYRLRVEQLTTAHTQELEVIDHAIAAVLGTGSPIGTRGHRHPSATEEKTS